LHDSVGFLDGSIERVGRMAPLFAEDGLRETLAFRIAPPLAP
jgi:hypothetical protein